MFGIYIALLIVLILVGIPIGYVLGIISVLICTTGGYSLPTIAVAQRMITSLDSFPLMAIPFFIFAGNIMSRGIFARKLVDFASALIGHRKGGLGMVAVLGCMFFAALSGSAVATAACIGALLIPELINHGYDNEFASATVASASVVGPIIPPSIPMVLYGVAVGCSIGDLFLGGIIPGILIGVGLMIWCYFYAKKQNLPVAERMPWGQRLKVTINALPAIFMPVIVLGGIYSGIFTPTEAAVIAVIYAVLIDLIIFRSMKFRELFQIAVDSAVSSACILFIVSTAQGLAWVMTSLQIPQDITTAILSVTSNKFMLLLLINIILLVVGCIMDTNAAVLIMAPIFAPIMTAVGVPLVALGVIVVTNLCIGLITPPVGMCLYVTANISKVSLGGMLKKIVPMLLIEIVVLFLITYVEPLIMFLPNLMN